MLPDWVDRVHTFRAAELQRLLQQHGRWFYGKDLLEIGSGSGFQLQILSSICRSSVGLETPASWYRDNRIVDLVEYDGSRIPFPDASFDIIFSSHVLQFLTEEHGLYDEMRRVLRPGGVAIHVVPTATWRLWTSIFHYPAQAQLLIRRLLARRQLRVADRMRMEGVTSPWLRRVNLLLPRRHGARGNWFTEHLIFQSGAWHRTLARHGWIAERSKPLGLWYSGYLLAGRALSMRSRSRLSRILGSSSITILASPAQGFVRQAVTADDSSSDAKGLGA